MQRQYGTCYVPGKHIWSQQPRNQEQYPLSWESNSTLSLFLPWLGLGGHQLLATNLGSFNILRISRNGYWLLASRITARQELSKGKGIQGEEATSQEALEKWNLFHRRLPHPPVFLFGICAGKMLPLSWWLTSPPLHAQV